MFKTDYFNPLTKYNYINTSSYKNTLFHYQNIKEIKFSKIKIAGNMLTKNENSISINYFVFQKMMIIFV